MFSLISSGMRLILQEFYKEKNSSIHLREICRRTNLHEVSTSRFLKKLEEEKIISHTSEGNLKKYYFVKNNKSFFIFECFDMLKFDELPDLRRNAINLFIQTLKEKPIFAILFGSTAKNNFQESSDIDLLIVSNNKISVSNAKKEVHALTNITINTIQISFPDFFRELRLKEDKVVQSALTSGYPIYNNVAFYEVFYERTQS